MLNEPSILANDAALVMPEAAPETYEQASADQQIHLPLETVVAEVMNIARVEQNPSPAVSASFAGQLRVDSETAYEHLDTEFAALDHHALLTTDEQDRHVIVAIRGRIRPGVRPWWPNALLLGLTLLSLLYAGAAHQAGMDGRTSIRLWEGAPYALSMLLILGTHELGHYFAARFHKVNVTLPYFIPAPFNFGTLGAFIQLREPMRNRKVLFDVGVAGPLAGLVVTLPILMIGLATSKIEPLPTEDYILEGDSVLYSTAKYAVFGEFLPNDQEDVFINQLAKAGWTGLFITGLNLIPLGQLDGGHVIFTLLGRRAQYLFFPILSLFFLLSMYNPAWLLWTVLLFLLGRVYAVPSDTVTRLDERRRWLGYGAMVVFVLVFVPDPLQLISR